MNDDLYSIRLHEAQKVNTDIKHLLPNRTEKSVDVITANKQLDKSAYCE